MALAGLLTAAAPAATVAPADRLAGASPRVDDARLESALRLLDATDETRQLRAGLAAGGVTLRTASIPSEVFARYRVEEHLLEVNARWADAPPEEVATMIAHEAVHARDAVSGYLATGASACVDSEVRAFRATARTWLALAPTAAREGASSSLEQQLDQAATLYQHDPTQLDQAVRDTYQDSCGQA